MSHSYTDSSVFDSSITIPDDGDDIDAASVNVAFEALADRTKYLKYLGRNTIIDACSSMPTGYANTDLVETTIAATNELLANVAAFNVDIKYDDVIHFSCTFNAQVTGVGDGWVTALLAYHDANNDLKYAALGANFAYVSGDDTEIRQYTINGALKVKVSPKANTACAITLFGRVESDTLTLRNPIACTWTVMRAL